MEIRLASQEWLEALVDLFDQYRVFYQQPSERTAVQTFLAQRLQNQDSVIWVAQNGERLVGFTQLYPSFSSVSLRPIWILNDLFVAPSFRRQGVAKRLLNGAEQHARQTGAVRIVLATQIANASAQALYESLGYIKDTQFYHYALAL